MSKRLQGLVLTGAAMLVAGCTTAIAPIAAARHITPVTLSPKQRAVVARDTRPSIRNAAEDGKSLDEIGATFRNITAARADGRIYVCGWIDAGNPALGTVTSLAFEGELVQSVMFIREYLGGRDDQNAFVRDACAKRGIRLP